MRELLVASLPAGTTYVGAVLLRLQARLERWDYERHAED